MERPRHTEEAPSPAKQEAPAPAGTQDTKHREHVRHARLLQRLLGACPSPLSVPSNTLPLQPPIYCSRIRFQKGQSALHLHPKHGCHTQWEHGAGAESQACSYTDSEAPS